MLQLYTHGITLLYVNSYYASNSSYGPEYPPKFLFKLFTDSFNSPETLNPHKSQDTLAYFTTFYPTKYCKVRMGMEFFWGVKLQPKVLLLFIINTVSVILIV